MSDLTFSSLEVLAVAVAAYESNGSYVKTAEYDYNTNMPTTTKYPNKQLVRAYFDLDHYSADAPRPPLVKVTDEHRARALEIQNYSKKAIFKVLAKKPKDISIFGIDLSTTGDYEERLYQIINQETVQAFDFGYIASAPLYFENGKKRDYAKSALDNLDSKWTGSVGGRIFLHNFEVIRCTKSKNFDGYVVQGLCDGNLYIYFSSKDCSHIKVGDRIDIEGKVKDHVMEKDTIPMTKLNYVRERIKNENQATV